MSKYELLYRQLLHEGTLESENFFDPGYPEDQDLLAVHTAQYVEDLRNLTIDKAMIRRIGFPLSEKLVEREHLITQGTIIGAQKALEGGIALNIAGGTHHAFTNRGEAFCLFNDQAVAARALQSRGLAQQILIVDLDVHQGNGTAEIFQGDDSVFTFSMHGAKNYPFQKEQSDLDIELPDGTGDQEYLEILEQTLPGLIDSVKPDFVFYLSGVDIVATDKLGRLGCSPEGCANRDRFVLETLKERELPVQVSMGGGYSPQIKTIIEAHANIYRIAQELYG